MSGNRIPYFDFYPTDFMRGVRGLTPTEVGIYTMLLCRIYEENGPVEYHPVRLSAYCGTRESVLTKAVDRLIVLGRIHVHNGMLSDDRAMKEIGIRETKLKNSSRAGKASAEKRQQNQSKNATGVEQPFNHTDTDKDKDIPEANASGRDASEEADPKKEFWEKAKAFLSKNGIPQSQSGSFVGKCLREHGLDRTREAFRAAQAEKPAEPIPWITACLTKPANQPAITPNIIRLLQAKVEEDLEWERQHRAAR